MSSIHKAEYIEFIARLRRARIASGFTQEEIAHLMNKPQSYVSKVETCERRLDLIEAAQWCRCLGVSLESLLSSV